MDIHGWLLGVTKEEQRGKPDQITPPSFLQPKDGGLDPLERSHRPRKTTASSFLDPAEPPLHYSTAYPRNEKRPISHSSSSSAVESLASNISRPGKNYPETDGKYTRQPRRKTRPDLYEPKLVKEKRKRRSKKRDPANDGDERPKRNEQPKARKKSRQLNPAAERDFHADNVRTNRLTLRPLNDYGLFSKVKTSASRRHAELPDLAFADMKFLKVPPVTLETTGVASSKQSTDDQDPRMYSVSSRHNALKDHDARLRGHMRSDQISGAGVTPKSVIESTSSKQVLQATSLANPHPASERGVHAEARPSSSCLMWSQSGIQSGRGASYPKAPESIHVAAFKFKRGPFRSSSVEISKQLVDSTIQKAKLKNGVRSDSGNDRSLELESGGISYIRSPEAHLSRKGARHGDKDPHPTPGSAADNRIFEPQGSTHHFPPHMSKPLASSRREGTQSQPSVIPSQFSDVQSIKPHGRVSGLSSTAKLLQECHRAELQATQSVMFKDQHHIIPAQPTHVQAPEIYPELLIQEGGHLMAQVEEQEWGGMQYYTASFGPEQFDEISDHAVSNIDEAAFHYEEQYPDWNDIGEDRPYADDVWMDGQNGRIGDMDPVPPVLTNGGFQDSEPVHELSGRAFWRPHKLY